MDTEQDNANQAEDNTAGMSHNVSLEKKIPRSIKWSIFANPLIIFSLIMFLLFFAGMISNSYVTVTQIGNIFYFIGLPGAVVIGIVLARKTFTNVKAKDTSKTYSPLVVHNKKAPIPIKAITLGVLAFVVTAGSLTLVVFIAAIMLGQRACELSSSKCY